VLRHNCENVRCGVAYGRHCILSAAPQRLLRRGLACGAKLLTELFGRVR
jgi:hypothetical protein